ncbi:MAG: uracil phosphoribosyltransferase [Alphaproteobacteria bacterium]|nr:uracil phosphoribosyltransferase [Alphaproteobacteria bacterium]
MPGFEGFSNVHLLSHPLIAHKLNQLRDRATSVRDFRALVRELALLMAFEATRNLPTERRSIETPLARTEGLFVDEDQVVIVPILRAGLTMAEGMVTLIPGARIGHIGVYRDHDTLAIHEYLVRLPPIGRQTFIIVDPMLATANSTLHALKVLNDHGVPDERLRLMSLVTAPEGVRALATAHPRLAIYIAAIDQGLNEKGYIVPGLGDAGDRLFGTT